MGTPSKKAGRSIAKPDARMKKRPTVAVAGKVSRARAVIAACHRVLVRATDQPRLLDDICRILVDQGGYDMAWAGLVRHDADSSIERVASAGGEAGYFLKVQTSWADNEFGQGPRGLAVRTGKPQTVRDLNTDRRFSRWRGWAASHGFVSSATLPLLCGSEVVGVFGILSKRA